MIKIVPYKKQENKKGGLLWYSVVRAVMWLFSCYYLIGSKRFPSAIEVETINRCNNDCSFCPVSRTADSREYAQMDMSLIRKIAGELREVNYTGLIALFSNNEPFVDKRISEICAIFREAAPRAHIYMHTNGISLTFERYVEVFRSGLNEMIISNYDDSLSVTRYVQRLFDDLRTFGTDDEFISFCRSHTTVSMRLKNEVLSNRGGSAPNKSIDEYHDYMGLKKVGCVLPSVQFVVRPNGLVSLCCQDALGKVTMGSVVENSIKEIWRSKAFVGIRRNLMRDGRSSISQCSNCDALFFYKAILKRDLYRFFRVSMNKYSVAD